jgi:hypothetical protein
MRDVRDDLCAPSEGDTKLLWHPGDHPVPPGQKPFAHQSADVDGVGFSTPHGPREVHIPNNHAALFHMLLIRR